jgi:hypothetical protein
MGWRVCLAALLSVVLFDASNQGMAEPNGVASRPGPLKVSDNGRWLVYADGTPFFYLADTAWELFHRLKREEAEAYLEKRAAQGFTVIQAVVLAEYDGLKTPNPYGHVPLQGTDPTKPVEPYFQHVDYIVDRAARLGLTIGMLPTWGDKWNRKWGVGPEVFTPQNAAAFGAFLGRRYKDKPIIWILGGDRNPENEQHLAVIRAMAVGLKKGDAGNHLMTYHPQGGSNSSRWFHQDGWLSFNMFQSGHGKRDFPNDELTMANYRLMPVKPTLDGEPRYEDHPINWKPANGWFDEADVRQAAYWSLLAGACGHTYGNHDIWQFFQPGRKPISSARTPWQQAIDQPGAWQMGHVRRLFESRPYPKLVPDQSVFVGDAGRGAEHARAARAEDGSFLLAYLPTGKPMTLRMNVLGGAKVQAWWFDPRRGEAIAVGEYGNTGTVLFTPPREPRRGNDWVLVLDDVAPGFAPPGQRAR